MDVSLDDYISKSNFRVQIGNSKSSFQAGRKPASKFQAQPITDVSITVPGVQKQPGLKINKTNQVRDARDRLSAKAKTGDAREKLNQKAQSTDARQKLLNIRAQKGQGPGGAVDARVKLQAKRIQGGAQGQGPPGALNLTRTVGNAGAATGVSGGVQFTRTLKCVMPPGYEDLTAPKPKTTVGPPQQITRTINQPPQTIIRTVPGNLQAPPPSVIPQQIYPPPPGQAYPPGPVIYRDQPPPMQPPPMQPPPTQPQLYFGQPPPAPIQQPPYSYPPPQVSQAPPPAQHIQFVQPPPVAPSYPPQGPPYLAPPPESPVTPLSGGPPYPVDDHIQITRTVGKQIGQPVSAGPPEIPRILVRNDQYQPPQQFPVYPPREPEYPQNDPQETAYYNESRTQPVLKRTVPNTQSVSDDTPRSVPYESQIKRKVPVGGPLRLSNTNTTPVIDVPLGRASEVPKGRSSSSAIKYSTRTSAEEPPVKKTRDEVVSEADDVISPLQGYKIVVTNLHPSVTQDDIIELFGAVGAVKKVKLAKPGLAEVVYVKGDDAATATKTYNNRELDGMPMIVKMFTPASAKIVEAPERLPANVKPPASGPLKLNKKPAGMAKVSDKKSVELSTLHKALFKIGATSSSKPVTFTVNI